MSSIVNFDDFNRNQINVAIVGAVSAGKSTLLNALFVASYSDMKIKRTTMTPQVYYETNKESKKTSKIIKKQNAEINKALADKPRDSLTLEDIQETCYLVPRVKGLHNLNNQVFLTVYDIPGLNDAQTEEIYFEYLSQNFYKFDLILFVVDINSALNTSGEAKILEKILENAKINKVQHGIEKKLVVVANKCDEIHFEGKKFEFLDEELTEMYEQIQKIVSERVENIYPEIDYKIVPLSSEDSYIYRMYGENPEYELDIKHINKFGCNEYGRSRWNRLSEEQKKSKIKELMKKMDIEDTLLHTGFNSFSGTFQKYLNHENQYTFLMNHLRYGLSNITNFNQLDISSETQKFYLYFQRFNEINTSFTRYLGEEKCNNLVFLFYLDSFMTEYEKHIISQYINIPDLTIKQNSYLAQVEKLKQMFDEFCSSFNGESQKIYELKNKITESLNNYYVSHIKSKKSKVSLLIDYLYRLFKQNFKINNDLVQDIFNNNDMMNMHSEQVIMQLENLEEKNIITFNQKRNIMLNFMKTIYKSTLELKEFQNIPKNIRSVYFYYADVFWSKVINDDFDIQLYDAEIIGVFNELGFLSKKNLHKYVSQEGSDEIFEKPITEIICLEKYLYELFSEPKVTIKKTTKVISSTSKELKKMKKSYSSAVSSSDDSGNLSEEIDNELGLVNPV